MAPVVVYMLQHISHFADIGDGIEMYLWCTGDNVVGHLVDTLCDMLT